MVNFINLQIKGVSQISKPNVVYMNFKILSSFLGNSVIFDVNFHGFQSQCNSTVCMGNQIRLFIVAAINSSLLVNIMLYFLYMCNTVY